MIGVRFEGIEDIQRYLDNYKKGLERQIFDEWATRVTLAAKGLCNDLIANVSDDYSKSNRILKILA